MKPYSKASYLSQVRRLRSFSLEALKCYPIKVKKLKFINHGENTTFKVTAQGGREYLLRIHRKDYHTLNAIIEELQWLKKLSKQPQFLVPSPLNSKTGKLIETHSTESVGTRNFCVFHWIDGHFLEKSLSTKHMFQMGQLIADLHKSPPKTRHRIYWDAEGLLGKNGKFGDLDEVSWINSNDRRIILAEKNRVFKRLKDYQKRNPKKMGLIHADLHFGNVLISDSKLGAIDFDDCGYGFQMYDLAIPVISAQNTFGKKDQQKLKALSEALIEGYKTKRAFTKDDEKILDDLITARKLTMLTWLNQRLDNPLLAKYRKFFIKRVLSHITK